VQPDVRKRHGLLGHTDPPALVDPEELLVWGLAELAVLSGLAVPRRLRHDWIVKVPDLEGCRVSKGQIGQYATFGSASLPSGPYAARARAVMSNASSFVGCVIGCEARHRNADHRPFMQ
jgi:hypothetical protein